MKSTHSPWRYAGLSLLALLVSACSDDKNYDFEGSKQRGTPFVASFNPSQRVLPFPTDLFFTGTEDGTLNFPISDPSNTADPLLAVNELDGFSVSSPITTRFSKDLRADSAVLGESVHVYETQRDDNNNISVVRALTAADVALNVQGSQLAVVPLKPLKESTSYLFVLTKGLLSTDGQAATSSSVYNLAAGDKALNEIPAFAELEPLRVATNGFHQLAATQGVDASQIVLSWSVTTQSVTPVLNAVREASAAGAVQVVNSGQTTGSLIPASTGDTQVYVGSLAVPYYLTAPSQDNPTAALSSAWRNAAEQVVHARTDSTPVSTSTQVIPLIATVPAGTAPADGWPMVIYQHGITSNRSTVLAIADALAGVGIAAIAIDLPLHGLTDSSSALFANADQFAGISERTFNMDLLNNSTNAPGPDGATDPSGAHFINLRSLLTSRDNVRQAVSDLLTLRRSLTNLQGIPVNQDRVFYLGMSLGGIVGTVYLGTETTGQIQAAMLSVPGAGIPGLLSASASYGPIIDGGLAASGITAGSEQYRQFMLMAQTVVDSADPFNFGATAAENQRVMLHEVVGGNSSPPDQVIPNSAEGSAISGTEPLIRVMGLQSVSSTTQNALGLDGAVRFIAGAHASLLSPESDLETTKEMQSQMAGFFASDGTTIPVTNADVVKQ